MEESSAINIALGLSKAGACFLVEYVTFIAIVLAPHIFEAFIVHRNRVVSSAVDAAGTHCVKEDFVVFLLTDANVCDIVAVVEWVENGCGFLTARV